MSKTIKLLMTILLVAVLSMTFVPNIAMADPGDGGEGTGESYETTIDTMFDQTAQGTDNLTTVGGRIVDIITTVGIVVAVVVLLILGIKYMMGSASEKAEYKKTMIPYLVGAVLIFGASAIAKAVVGMSQGITGS